MPEGLLPLLTGVWRQPKPKGKAKAKAKNRGIVRLKWKAKTGVR